MMVRQFLWLERTDQGLSLGLIMQVDSEQLRMCINRVIELDYVKTKLIRWYM